MESVKKSEQARESEGFMPVLSSVSNSFEIQIQHCRPCIVYVRGTSKCNDYLIKVPAGSPSGGGDVAI